MPGYGGKKVMFVNKYLWYHYHSNLHISTPITSHQSPPTSHTLPYNMNYPMVTFNQNTQLGYGQYSNNLSSQQATYQHFCDSMLPAAGHTSMVVSEYHGNADSLLSYELNARKSYESDENIHTGGKLTQRKSPKAKNRFPQKLYRMLELASNQFFGYSSYSVSWLSHGQAFKILDEDRFMMYIVPSFFKQTQVRSFYRQLSLWGFKRLISGQDAGAWYHENFVRASPSKMTFIKRTKIRNIQATRVSLCDEQRLGAEIEPGSDASVSSNEDSANQIQGNDRGSTIKQEADEMPEVDFETANKTPGENGSKEEIPSFDMSIEPIPLNDDVPSDEFAQYIDAAIHVL